MFGNHLKIWIRNLLIHKKFSLINILGLAIGFTGFILVMLWVQDELSYDKFHKNADDTYLVLRSSNSKVSAMTSKMLGPAIKSEIPEINNATDYATLPEPFKPFFQYNDKGFEESFALTDSHFFEVFSFDFIHGNSGNAFSDPNSIVMTERLAKKYFGNSNAINKSVEMTFLGQKKTLKITGIIKDYPHNSYFQRDILLPLDFMLAFGVKWNSWQNYSVQTFIQTQNDIVKSVVEKKILDCENRNIGNLNLGTTGYSLLPLGDIHLRSNNIEFFNSTGDIKYIYIFTIVAVIILLIACMNYINLTNASSIRRIKEISIKKVLGANWKDLILQYYGETTVITVVALVLSLVFVTILLPFLNTIAGKELSINFSSPEFILTITSITILTIIISGISQAIFSTRFSPSQILKGKFQKSSKKMNLQKGIVILQFALSIAIIACTFIVMSQLNFMKDAYLGYDKENIISIRMNETVVGKYEAFKNKLLSNSNIMNISRSEPMDEKMLGSTEGINWEGKTKKFSSWLLHVDSDFAATYKLKMKEGVFFSDQYSTDKTSAYVINETAAKEMGFKSAVGKELDVWGIKGKIIGVAKDFNFSSLYNLIEPVIMQIPNREEASIYYSSISVRLNPDNISQSIKYIQNTWRNFFPGVPFNFYFVDESQNANYLAEQRMGNIFKYFAILAIFIACIGLYGLTAFSIERKIKDIGIHKVLGADVPKIMYMLLKNYLRWIVISNIIAFPVVYYFMDKWLRDFAYRIEISWWMFIISGGMALLIALATVSYQAIKAAIANPVESLRYE
jgi:putative ABC transport system permease protein